MDFLSSKVPFDNPHDIGNVAYNPNSGEYPHHFKLAIDGKPLQEGTLLHSGSFSVVTCKGNKPEDEGFTVEKLLATAPLGKSGHVFKFYTSNALGEFGDIYSYFNSQGCQYVDFYLYCDFSLGKSRLYGPIPVGTFLLVSEPAIDLVNAYNSFSNVLRADTIQLTETSLNAGSLIGLPIPLNVKCYPVTELILRKDYSWNISTAPLELLQPFKCYYTKEKITISAQTVENFKPANFINYQKFDNITVYLFRSIRYKPYFVKKYNLVRVTNNHGYISTHSSAGVTTHGYMPRFANENCIEY